MVCVQKRAEGLKKGVAKGLGDLLLMGRSMGIIGSLKSRGTINIGVEERLDVGIYFSYIHSP